MQIPDKNDILKQHLENCLADLTQRLHNIRMPTQHASSPGSPSHTSFSYSHFSCLSPTRIEEKTATANEIKTITVPNFEEENIVEVVAGEELQTWRWEDGRLGDGAESEVQQSGKERAANGCLVYQAEGVFMSCQAEEEATGEEVIVSQEEQAEETDEEHEDECLLRARRLLACLNGGILQ